MKSKYLKYKSSKVDWIREIPSHWILKKNKYILDEKDEVVGEKWGDYTLLSLSKRGVIIRDIESGKGKFPESFDTYKIVNKNELIFCLYDIEETPRSVGLSNDRGMITGSYKVFSSNKVNVKYVYYYYLCIDDVKGLKPYYTGLRNVVRPETFGGLKLYLPPNHEQEQIVNYLDERTSQVDNLISITGKKIEVLKEKRSSLINTVVTKGLNPKGELKDSEVEWIGEIPKHWKIVRLKYTSNVRTSSVDKHIFEEEKQVRVCNYTDVYYNERIDDKVELRKGSCSEEEYNRFKLNRGDVIITKDSETPDDIGVPSYVSINFDDVVCGYHLSIISPDTKILLGEFLLRQFQTKRVRNYFEINSNGITRFGLGKSSIEETEIILPPTSEQEEIVKYLDTETKMIDTLVSIEQRRIETLKEYRQSLVSEVITGKVRVCEEEVLKQDLVLEK